MPETIVASNFTHYINNIQQGCLLASMTAYGNGREMNVTLSTTVGGNS